MLTGLKDGLADYLGVDSSRVEILSISDGTSDRRRRLLQNSLAIDFLILADSPQEAAALQTHVQAAAADPTLIPVGAALAAVVQVATIAAVVVTPQQLNQLVANITAAAAAPKSPVQPSVNPGSAVLTYVSSSSLCPSPVSQCIVQGFNLVWDKNGNVMFATMDPNPKDLCHLIVGFTFPGATLPPVSHAGGTMTGADNSTSITFTSNSLVLANGTCSHTFKWRTNLYSAVQPGVGIFKIVRTNMSSPAGGDCVGEWDNVNHTCGQGYWVSVAAGGTIQFADASAAPYCDAFIATTDVGSIRDEGTFTVAAVVANYAVRYGNTTGGIVSGTYDNNVYVLSGWSESSSQSCTMTYTVDKATYPVVERVLVPDTCLISPNCRRLRS